MFTGRILRLIVIPLSAFGILLAIYFRELFRTPELISAESVPPGVKLQAPPVVPGTCDLPLVKEYVQENYSPESYSPESYTGAPALHIFREDGVLEVNPGGRHPILELIDRAEARWKRKLGRASKTLDEAVTEYIRRYRRVPPKGFDAWWNYVELHNVQLPDEYDQIWKDLEPFWGIDPVVLQHIQKQQESHKDTYTIGKTSTDPHIKVFNVSFTNPEQHHLLSGAEDVKSLLQDVQQHIPPFRAVFSPHDSPTLFSDYEVKNALLDAASRQSYVNLSTITPGERLGWLSGCAPSTVARNNQATSSPPGKKTFIFDHLKAMDPCLHPQLLEGHGDFIVHDNPGAQRGMIPQFAYCSTMLHHDIQAPLLMSWVEEILPRNDDPIWEEKLDSRLNWRGSNTGIWHAPETKWRSAQRARLVDFARQLNGTVNVLIPPSIGSSNDRVGEGMEVARHQLNPALFDIAFAGEPVQCGPSTFCEELGHTFEWRKRQGAKESGNFKYIIDVDGNAWSSRFKRLITSNSLIFKATIYPEWFYDRVEPWVHYVPIQADYSDLYDSLLFFRGGLYGEGSHEDLARKIGSAGRTWSKEFWRKEDITAYLFRLMLEYARVMSLDREAMSYIAQS